MSGSAIRTSKKISWRNEVCRFLCSTSSSTKVPATSTVPSPSPPASPPSPPPPSVPSLSTTSTAVLPSSSSTRVSPGPSAKNASLVGLSPTTLATTRLLPNALLRLKDEERATIERNILLSSVDIQLAIGHAVKAVESKRQACLDKRWSVTIGGRDVVLREKADKVVHWLDRFKPVGDVVANANPIHIGLPWAGIRLLLEVTVVESRQMAALLAGCETILYMAARLQVYVEFWYQLPVTAARNNLEESITAMYAHILHFLARAILVYEISAVRRTFAALWRVDDTIDFGRKGSNLAMKVEFDASNCDRGQLQHDMQRVLAELQHYHQLQASLDHLDIKIDLGKIPYAKGAIFNSYDGMHTLCHPATRRDILSQVQNWAQQPDDKSIFWLRGGAGTGKSTISWTTAHWLTELGSHGGVGLGASFFFKRGEGDRDSARRFFPTIIRQLVTKISGLDVLVARAVDFDPFIFDKALGEQFRRLILQPLQALSVSSAHRMSLVVVVDALDECGRETDIRTILKLWSQLSQLTSVRLRLFLTSRPELAIRLEFGRIPIDRFYTVDLVDAVPSNTIRHDLSVYLNDSLCSIRDDYNHSLPGTLALQDSWPDHDSVQRLVNVAVPLFIVAATLCRLIGDIGSNPQDSLEEILSNQATDQMSQMELTYLPVLSHLNSRARGEMQKERLHRDFRLIVGSIILLAEPLSASSLATLLDTSIVSVNQRLAPLHSVLQVPSNIDIPIRMLHLSFAEFLSSEQAQKQPFGVNGPSAHLALSKHCLRVLSSPDGLRENICDLDYPGQPRYEVKPMTINSRLSSVLQYACQYWIYHVKLSLCQPHDLDKVYVFLQRHFLHWLEALSLMDRLSEAISLINDLQSCALMTHSDLSTFLKDARRFVLANQYIVNLAPLQLYSSAIIFAPHNSVVRRKCGRVPMWIRQYPETPREWDFKLQKLEGHSELVWTVAFSSPNGALIASGSNDGTIRLWETQTSREVQTLQGHSEMVRSVTFSPDGTLLASGSWDKSIQLWDVQTGRGIQTIRVSAPVEAVAFSPDGTLLAGASAIDLICLWNLRTGREVQTLEGHCDMITSVTFSPDGSLLASGSRDDSIRLWDVQTGYEVLTLESSPIHSNTVAFSPDGALLASRFRDGSVRLWDTQTGLVVQKLQGYSGPVTAVAFSPDGALLTTASIDDSIRLWDTRTGREVQKVDSTHVHTVAFSPDGGLLASGSGSIIQLWDMHTIWREEKSTHHSESVRRLLFSADGALLASGSEDGTIRLWDTQTGRETKHFKHSRWDWLDKLAFSPDGTMLASKSRGSDVRLWDTRTGLELQRFADHPSLTKDAAFWTNGWIVSGSGDQTRQPWDAQTDGEAHRLRNVSALQFEHFEEGVIPRKYNEWIRRGGQNLLWLPYEYRGCVTSHGDRVAVGSHTGLVSIFQFGDMSEPVA